MHTGPRPAPLSTPFTSGSHGALRHGATTTQKLLIDLSGTNFANRNRDSGLAANFNGNVNYSRFVRSTALQCG